MPSPPDPGAPLPPPRRPGPPGQPHRPRLGVPEQTGAPRPAPEGRGPISPALPVQGGDEAERALTRANIQLRRGLTADADAAVGFLLAQSPDHAGAWELLADIRQARGDLAGTLEALRKSLAAQPGRATAEVKLGRVVLQVSERERMQTLGTAYVASEPSLMGTSGAGSGRGTQWAAVGSALIPGLGQYANGEVVKGIVVASVYFLSLLLLSLLPDTQNLLHAVAGTVAGGHAHHGGQAGSGGGSIAAALLFVTMTASWLYGIVDASRAAKRAALPGIDAQRQL